MKQKIITLLIMLLPIALFAQEKLYSVKGCVVARYSGTKFKVEPFVAVLLTDTTENIYIGGSQTDFDGMYYIDSIPEGRYKLKVSYVFYDSYDTVLTINSDCNIDTVKIYSRLHNINGARIWERQVKIGVLDYSDLYREIYMDYRMAIKGLNKTIDKKIGKLPKRYDALRRVKVDTILTHLKGVSMKRAMYWMYFIKVEEVAAWLTFIVEKLMNENTERIRHWKSLKTYWII